MLPERNRSNGLGLDIPLVSGGIAFQVATIFQWPNCPTFADYIQVNNAKGAITRTGMGNNAKWGIIGRGMPKGGIIGRECCMGEKGQ